MATIEKLTKALEALKVVQTAVTSEDSQKKPENISKKERIIHCSTIADSICSHSLRSTPDFQKVLGFATETFLVCCDDEDSDVRLMADECLNRTIKTLLDSHLNRLQLELYKEIKKDGSARSLRAALSRFGDLCHKIRPEKFRPYAVNLLPCLAKMSQRAHEESVQDTLATAISKIMPVLGQFTNDKEIKMLLKAFLPNLSNSSATVRRAAASSLITVCHHSRRPSMFFSWLLSALFDIILPVQDNHSIYDIFGILLCLRQLVPHFSESTITFGKGISSMKHKDDDLSITKREILKVYEIVLFFSSHPDHNVVTAALEALHQLLKCASEVFQPFLLFPTGLTQAMIDSEFSKLNKAKSESQSSVIPLSSVIYDDSVLEDDHDVYLSEKSDEESQTYIEDVSRTSFDHADFSTSVECESDVSEYSGIKISKLIDENSFVMNVPGVHTSGTPRKIPPMLHKGISEDKLLETEDDQCCGDHSSSPSPSTKLEFKVGNIGTFTESSVPINFIARLLSSSFLLPGTPGSCMPDRNVRVSVKSLALSCLSCVFSIYPKAFFLDLYLDSVGSQGQSQKIWDIRLYASHPDPHLKGQCAVVLGNIIRHGLRESGGWWHKWVDDFESPECPSFCTLLSMLTSIVKDSSSVASKLGLGGLKQCLNYVIKSVHGVAVLSILDTLISMKDNSYWLVKVELLDVVSEIPFNVLHYLEREGKNEMLPLQKIYFQNKFLNDVFIPLLGDEDYRVRQAAAAAIVKLVPKLFFPADHPYQDPIISIAKEGTRQFFDLLQLPLFHSTLPLVHALVMPFSNQDAISHNEVVEGALTRIINVLMLALRTCTNKYLNYGCCQALFLLSETYLVTVYHQAWKTVFAEGKSIAKPCLNIIRHQSSLSSTRGEIPDVPCILSADLFSHLISLLTHTSFALDLMAHLNTLQLVGNLMCGAAYVILQEKQKSENVPAEEQKTQKENVFRPYTEQVFIHLMKLLNIFAHVLDEQPPITISNRPALPSLPNAPSLSPMKRKNRLKDESNFSSNNTAQNRSPTRIIQEKADTEKEKTNVKSFGHIGSFHLSPLYTKLYAILKGVYASYKISTDFQNNDKFCQLLKCTLDVLSQLLEIADSHEMGKHAEEILSYLKSVMSMEPCSSIQCVRQLLKSLFGTNLTALHQEAQLAVSDHKSSRSVQYTCTSPQGLYHTCIAEPYTKFTHTLANKGIKSGSAECEEELISSLSWMKRSDKLTNLLKSGTKCDKANLAAHIKLFEAVVIKALKLYTITSNVNLQCQVLDLLAQLVQLRVNYCLLDSDQIFIGFIMKQLEYIEEGQILKAGLLIPRIFYFLVLLSYERYHSKSIISVPKILQMCDGLIASGQPPEKYVIQALQPVVEDLFLVRGINKVDLGKELDAQREVVISTLFKLLQFQKVLDLFLLIVNQTLKEGEDKWRKLSRQIVDAVLPLLARQQLQVDNQAQLNTLHKLLESVAESVFRPVDILLKALFTKPKDLNNFPFLHRWMCMVLAILRIIISQTREEVVLSRMHDMDIVVNIYRLNVDESHIPSMKYLPSSMSTPDDSSQSAIYTASITLARFLFQVIGVSTSSICGSLCSASLQHNNEFLSLQISHMLLYLMYMFQSGTFRRVTASAMELVKSDVFIRNSDDQTAFPYYLISDINDMFFQLCSVYPTLVIQWCNVLTLLNYDSQLFWSKILLSDDHSPSLNSMKPYSINKNYPISHPCNFELVRRAGVILLCDYVCENPNDAELMTLLIVNHVNDLIQLSMETTIKDILSAVHRNPAASGLLIQAVDTRCTKLSEPVFMKRALRCLEAVHDSQSGNLLLLLIEKFLPTHCVILARYCDRIICRRIEMLINDSSLDQLHIDDIDNLMAMIVNSSGDKRHQRIYCLLQKLQNTGDSSSVLTASPAHPLVQTCSLLQGLEINKDWYIKHVKELCFARHPLVKECALLLSHLKYEDALAIMSSKEFQSQILERCLRLGAEMTISSEKYSRGKSNDPFLGIKNTSESSLYRASRTTLLSYIANLVALLSEAPNYDEQINKLFLEESFWEGLHHTVSATSCYLKILKHFYEHHNIPDDSMEDIARISVLCCEAMSWSITSGKIVPISSNLLHLSLELLNDALKNPTLFAVVALPENTTWTFATIHAIYQLTVHLNPKLTQKSITFPEQKVQVTSTPGQINAQQACVEISLIVEWLENSQRVELALPQFIFSPLKSIIRAISRLPIVNSFSRTPPILWQLGWNPGFGGDYKTLVPPPPGEYLQDRDVLKQYIFRVNLLGWISRQQFEETWMALLGVLSATPIDEVEGKEEDQERMRTSCLAVKSITSLLLQTLLLPEPGNPQNSSFLMQPRDKPLAFLHTKYGKKMLYVRSFIHRALQELTQNKRDDQPFTINAERVSRKSHYSLSQVSLEYLCAAAGFLEENDDVDESVSSNSSPLSSTLGGAACYHQREQSLAATGLDIHSCLHFLLDLYSQWLSPVACPCTPLTLLTEVVRSVVILSDIFMERAQFEWLLDTLLEVQRVHPAEDEIIAQYLIFGICKAAAVLGMEPDMMEKLKKLLELNLKSTYLPTRIATLHGFMFLLEQGGGNDSFPLLSAASDYILKHLDSSIVTKPSGQNEDHMLIMWAVSFYIVENYRDEVSEFCQKIFELSLNVCGCNDDDVPTSIYLTVFYGLERLLISGVFSTKDVELLLKLSADRITSCCPLRSLTALGVLVSCMYIGESNNLCLSDETLPSNSKASDKTEGNIKQLETDTFIAALERVTTLFERIRKGYPLEATVICQTLPPFLMEFFPVQDILNKVIGEFLSSQQPHPHLIAHVIYEVFQYLHMESYEDIIQDWVMLSLSNFTQRSPLAMAIWSLNCFFISSASNPWLQAIFPLVQNRMGKIESADNTLFCISGADFRNHLKDEEQKQAFFATIQSVAHSDTPYADLLSCL